MSVCDLYNLICNKSIIFYLLVPIPSLNVTSSSMTDLLAGSELTITCRIKIPGIIDISFKLGIRWRRRDRSDDDMDSSGDDSGDLGDEPQSETLNDTDRTTISSVMTGFNEYRSTVFFSTLSSIEDSGTYTCTVRVIPDSEYEYVIASDANDVNISLTVTGKYSYCFYLCMCTLSNCAHDDCTVCALLMKPAIKNSQ